MTVSILRILPLLLLLSVLVPPRGVLYLHAEEPLPPLPELQQTLPPLPDQQEEQDGTHTIWTCSMHPNIQLPGPGQCPICFMDLIEVTVDRGAKLSGLRQISLDENARRLAQVEVTPVSRGTAATSIRMLGKVDYDETLVSTITAWMNGRIDKLYIDYTGSKVTVGQPMAEIYSPELLTAQAELIEATAASRKSKTQQNILLENTIRKTEQAARKKLQLLGLSEGQINKVAEQGEPSDHVTLTAPISGIVINKGVTEGLYIKTGMPIYTIADLNRVWIVLEAYESDLHAIQMGQRVEFSAEAFPGIHFSGEVSYIDPLVNEKTRTVKVRLVVDNGDRKLKPGMFVRAVAQSRSSEGNSRMPLLIPASAPLITGKRAIIYVQLPEKEGLYEGREITLGSRRGDFYEVETGLTEGELVVTRGNFKIDSAVQIQARPSMMNPYTVRETADPAELPSLFLSKLNLLNRLFTRLSEAVHNNDPKVKEYFLDSFAKQLAGIQGDLLGSGEKLDWKELHMLLASDILLMQEASSMEELQRLYAEMATHFHQVRTRYHLDATVHTGLGSEELSRSLTKLLDAYLSLQKNLADDAEEKSLQDIQPITSAAADFTTELARFPDENSRKLSSVLEAALMQLKGSVNIEEIRAAFYPLSKIIIEAVSAYGVSTVYPIYEHYCPMAFNDTGANWLDTSEVISNPYFGDLMLRCGEVRRQLKTEEK